MRALVVAFVVPALLSTPARAQQETEETYPKKKVREVYAENETHDFDVTVIVGTPRKSPGIFVDSRTGKKFPTQIEERIHFKRELAKSAGFAVKVQETTITE